MTGAPQRPELGLDDAVLSARILGVIEAVNECDTDEGVLPASDGRYGPAVTSRPPHPSVTIRV